MTSGSILRLQGGVWIALQGAKAGEAGGEEGAMYKNLLSTFAVFLTVVFYFFGGDLL